MASREKVAIIGSGLIGRSWSMLFAAADYDVTLYDIDEIQLEGALVDISKQLEQLAKQGLLRGVLTADQQYRNIKTTSVLEECVKDAVFIQESVPEKIELKQAVYQQIDGIISDTCILSSSASALLPSKLSVNLKHRNRFVVSHPTNPPFYAPLVELIPSPWADKDVLSKAKVIMEKIGQVPVVLKKEIDGFVLNRIQYSIMKECWRLIQDDVIDVDGLDKVMSAGLGRRYAFMGPIETAYLNADGMYSYADRYASMIDRVMASFRDPEPFAGPVLHTVQEQMVQKIPLDKLEERRAWRDKRLAGLTQMIHRLDQQ